MIWSPTAFLTLGIKIARSMDSKKANVNAEINFFKRTYGVSPDVCGHSWEYLINYGVLSEKALPKHLLWALIMLNTYGTEIFLARLLETTEKTFRKWVWHVIDGISNLYCYLVSVLLYIYCNDFL